MAIQAFACFKDNRSRRALKQLLLFLLVLLSCLNGCTLPAYIDEPETQPVSPAGHTTDSWPAGSPTPTPGPVNQPGGDLRIWWPPRTNLNPLLETTLTGRAVYDLIYPGLFRITADEQLEQVLAGNVLVFDGGLYLLIALEPGRTFHDGRPVTAADVMAVLQHLMSTDDQSIWGYGFDAIDTVQALNDQVLEIQLNRPDPWLAWSLIFPVIPAEYIDETGFTLIPGSGPYAIEWYDPGQGLYLKNVQEPADPAKLQHILVRAYRNQQEAMRALEQDELDLVLLDAQLLSRYTVRSSLRVDHFSSEELLFISYNTNPNRLLHDEAALCLVKQLVNHLRETGHAFCAWGEASPLGLTAASWLNDAETVQPASILAAEPADWPETTRSLVMIAPQQDRRRAQLIVALADALEQAGIACTIRLLDATDFTSELQAGRYDLALLSAHLPARPEPGFLIREPVPDVFAALDTIRPAAGGLAEAQDWQERWQQMRATDQLRPVTVESVNPAWLQALTEALTRSAWDPLCLSHMGLVYGDRVNGQCRPSRYHPYQNIEELWVWSG